MFTVTAKDDHCDVKLDTDVYISMYDSLLISLLSRIRQFKDVAPLKFVKVTRTSALHWELKIKAVDGRIWNQTFTFLSFADADPSCTYNISDPWKINETGMMRGVRDLLPDLMRVYNVVALNVNW